MGAFDPGSAQVQYPIFAEFRRQFRWDTSTLQDAGRNGHGHVELLFDGQLQVPDSPERQKYDRTSDRTLTTPVTMRLRFASIQAPGIDSSHTLDTGLHWKITDSTLARQKLKFTQTSI